MHFVNGSSLRWNSYWPTFSNDREQMKLLFFPQRDRMPSEWDMTPSYMFSIKPMVGLTKTHFGKVMSINLTYYSPGVCCAQPDLSSFCFRTWLLRLKKERSRYNKGTMWVYLTKCRALLHWSCQRGHVLKNR